MMNFLGIKKPYHLIGAILICQFAGILGSLFTFPSIQTWYVTLSKPSFTPPNWVFGPVWLTLYTLMGISAYLVWEKGMKRREVREALTLFGIQLGLNSLWSVIFFGLHQLFIGLIEILALLAVLAYTILRFYGISKNAAYLLIPYFLWGCIATALTYSVWLLNP